MRRFNIQNILYCKLFTEIYINEKLSYSSQWSLTLDELGSKVSIISENWISIQ